MQLLIEMTTPWCTDTVERGADANPEPKRIVLPTELIFRERYSAMHDPFLLKEACDVLLLPHDKAFPANLCRTYTAVRSPCDLKLEAKIGPRSRYKPL